MKNEQTSHNGNHELRKNNYERIFGKSIPDFVRKSYGRDLDIIVYSFPPAPESGRDFWILATSGMSDFPQEEREKRGLPSRTEVLLYARDPKPWMYATLIHIAEFPFEKHTWLGALHTIEDVMPADCHETGNMHSVIFITPSDSPSVAFPLSADGNSVELLLAIPITASECKLADTEGSSALAGLLFSNGLDLFVNENRPSMVR